MQVAIIFVFIAGYILITLEHTLRVNKTAIALVMAVVCWTLFIFSSPSHELLSSPAFRALMESEKETLTGAASHFQHFVVHELGHHLTSISEILFFLMGAMTIVELIDAHHGFSIITEKIKTKNPRKLLWIVCWVTFFLSAVLDNLTSTIVMVSLGRKLIPDQKLKLLFTGLIVIAANAGGAWTPMGDVTTTMLWIGGQISTTRIIQSLFIPSVVCLLVPLVILSFSMKNNTITGEWEEATRKEVNGGRLMLTLGIIVLLAVPAFKIVTHLPPYIGMLLGLGILWIVSEVIHPDLDEEDRKNYTAAGALSRIDTSSILFFLGILLAVGVLESMLVLEKFSFYLAENVRDQRIIISIIGVLSAVVDNVPLVAASMGMYDMSLYPTDHFIWQYLAYCAGTGGSLLIIGSAAGVAAMGMEKIDFFWYVKKISWLALLGYISGSAVYLMANSF